MSSNIIDFPKNSEAEIRLLKNKLESAYSMLNFLIKNGAEFQIIIKSDFAKELFDNMDDLKCKYTILTTSIDYTQKTGFNFPNYIYEITGEELD